MEDRELIQAAAKAMENAYAPYSHFQVGAALETENGRIFTGCNVENASFGATNCAERTAVFKAVSEGERKFRKIAIVGGPQGVWTEAVFPCGICRQVLSEFCSPDFPIILGKPDGTIYRYSLKELNPGAFTAEDMNR